MIHLFCALKSEAKPVIEKYQLQHCPDAGLFTIYINEGQDLSLTVSGVGKLSMAGAVIYTASFLGASGENGWLNFGIAGHQDLEIGSTRLANKISDEASGKTWFPQIVFNSVVSGAPLITVDKPVSVYPGSTMYDMEAAGFYNSVCRFATAELAHSLKIVSDNELSPTEKINNALVNRLITDNLKAIDSVIFQLSGLSNELKQSEKLEDMYQSFIARWHFTQTEKIKLKQLLLRWQILLSNSSPLSGFSKQSQTGKEILNHLQHILDTTPVTLEEQSHHV